MVQVRTNHADLRHCNENSYFKELFQSLPTSFQKNQKN